jgi:alpha-tubulin suppressor-like RCC1 family protein
MTKQKNKQKSIAFGKPYFHATKSGPSGKTIEQAVCTTQSTVFLTSEGKIYQTGTLHGQIYKSPTLVEIRYALKCVEIAAGRHFCLGRLEGGQAVVSWGAGKRELVIRTALCFL